MEDFIPIFAIFAVFGSITAIIVGPTYFKSRERREMQATLRASIEKGQSLPPEVIEAISKDNAKSVPTAARDLRAGVILLSVAIGIALLGYAVSFADFDAFYPIVGGAAIPGMIGLAFIILRFFNKNKG